MRPSLSRIDESGRPSTVNLGKPDAVSASTRTRWASIPRTAAVSDVASNGLSLRNGGFVVVRARRDETGRGGRDLRPYRCEG
jgi:hypothetical protein